MRWRFALSLALLCFQPLAVLAGTPSPSPNSRPTSSLSISALGVLRFWPNPAGGDHVTAGFSMPSPGHARLRIFNSMGWLASLKEGQFGSGPAQLSLGLAGFAHGAYFSLLDIDLDSGGSQRLEGRFFRQ